VVPNLSFVDQVDGYSLLPNGYILATSFQFDNQIPLGQFARAFFMSLGYEILQKKYWLVGYYLNINY
jgi:hypothetical protein